MITKKKVHSVNWNCESGLVMMYKYAAHRLVQHMLQVRETCTDLLPFFNSLETVTSSIEDSVEL